MKIKKGHIYKFKYSKYKKDPTPLALILWSDEKIVHAINFNYLKAKLNDQLINFIVDVATKRIESYSMYSLYHNYIKWYLPDVIKISYRTYKPNNIGGIRLISRGFDILGIFGFIKRAYGIQEKKIIEKISKEIKYGKSIDLNGTTPQEAKERAQVFMDKIKEIYKPKLDKTKYTFKR